MRGVRAVQLGIWKVRVQDAGLRITVPCGL